MTLSSEIRAGPADRAPRRSAAIRLVLDLLADENFCLDKNQHFFNLFAQVIPMLVLIRAIPRVPAQ